MQKSMTKHPGTNCKRPNVGLHTDASSQVVGGSTPDIYAPKKLNPLRMKDLPSLDPNSVNVSNFTPRTPTDITRLQKELQDFPDQLL